MLARTIREDMRNHAQARAAIQDIVELPGIPIDRIIRSVESNQGKLSNMLAKEMPLPAEPGLLEAIVEVVERAFDGISRG